jgi:hypothetical protein
MMQKPHYIHYIIIWAILSLLVSSSPASWKKISQLPEPVGCVFFSDPNTGFAGTGNNSYNYTLEIWVTTNGGVTWTQAGVPVGDGQVTQIVMNPNGLGYASIFSSNNPRMNLWKTVDGGYTWSDISTGYQYGTGVGLTGITADWQDPINIGNNKNGVFTMAGGGTFITPGPYDKNYGEAWGAYGDSVQKLWYVIAEQNRSLYLTADQVKWQPRFNFGFKLTGGFLTGAIIGSGSRLYIQTEKNGIFRGSTLDSGAKWDAIGGPSNVYDTRTIFASGCNGQVIYAFDAQGGLWRSDDGGDGILATANHSLLMPTTNFNFKSVSSCLSEVTKGTITNQGCIPIIITSVSLTNNPSGAFTLLPPITVPDTLATGQSDTIGMFFNPKLVPGGFTAQLTIQGHFQALFGYPQSDTTITINISASAIAVAAQTETNLTDIYFDSTSICGGFEDSMFTIKNTGCDTVRIVSGPGALDSAFTFDTFALPLVLLPDSTIVIHVHFKPSHAGIVFSYPAYQIISQGTSSTIKFYVQGGGIAGVGVLSLGKQNFTFDTLTICSPPDSASGYMTNIGCGPLIIQDLSSSGNTDFTLSGIANGEEIKPGDTVVYTIHFTPKLKGVRSAAFAISIKDKNGATPPKNITLSASGVTISGTANINASLTSIDFGTTTLCQERDSSILLKNLGCDTLQISAAGVSGFGFLISPSTFPVFIPPGGSYQITVTTVLDTLGGKLQSIDSLEIFSNSVNPLHPIKLTRRISLSKAVGFYLDSAANRGTDQSVVYYNLKEIPGKSFTGSGVKQIDFDLPHNSDLLEFASSKSSANITGSPNGNAFSLTSNTEIAADQNGVLATVAFRVYLTNDSVTDIVLTNGKLHGADTASGPCAMTLSYFGIAHFNYDFVCGEHSIAGLMNGIMPMKIISLHPNPTQDAIELELRSPEKQRLQIEIFDALGVNVYSQNSEVVAGAGTVHLDTRNFPQGMYLVRIGNQAETFLKIR